MNLVFFLSKHISVYSYDFNGIKSMFRFCWGFFDYCLCVIIIIICCNYILIACGSPFTIEADFL